MVTREQDQINVENWLGIKISLPLLNPWGHDGQVLLKGWHIKEDNQSKNGRR